MFNLKKIAYVVKYHNKTILYNIHNVCLSGLVCFPHRWYCINYTKYAENNVMFLYIQMLIVYPCPLHPPPIVTEFTRYWTSMSRLANKPILHEILVGHFVINFSVETLKGGLFRDDCYIEFLRNSEKKIRYLPTKKWDYESHTRESDLATPISR